METTGGSHQKKLTYEEFEAAIDACKWIAALSPIPLERPIAFKRVFQLRQQQREQGRG